MKTIIILWFHLRTTKLEAVFFFIINDFFNSEDVGFNLSYRKKTEEESGRLGDSDIFFCNLIL